MMEGMDVAVIDDEEGMREGIARILRKHGFSVDLARDGETAIELLKQKTYDLAFVDLKMPGIDGFKVTEYINEKYALKTVVIIVSALATVEAAVEVTRHGAFDFLVKPFTPADLLQVTERAVQQRKLIQDREKYLSELNNERTLSRQLINAMQEGVVVLNILTEPVLMNPKAEYFLGKNFRETKNVSDLFADEKILAAVGEAADPSSGMTAERVFEIERNQTMLKIRVASLIREDEVGGAIIIVDDFTEDWKAEQDKNRFISMVAHELKSPIAAIINYINVILTGMFDANPEKIHELLARCNIRGEALLELIRDLLDINKRDSGKMEKSIETVDLGEVLEAQSDFYRGQAEGNGISLKVTTPSEPVVVKADRSDLDRIFMNLISNGLKYNREGGKLDIDLQRENGLCKVTVRDTGIGMSPEEMKNLFQEFYRVRNRKTGSISGTGLGLATVKRVLAEYNGRISVDSVPDQGSVFTVFLPASPGA